MITFMMAEFHLQQLFHFQVPGVVTVADSVMVHLNRENRSLMLLINVIPVYRICNDKMSISFFICFLYSSTCNTPLVW